jgi:hypothetical protein
LSERKYLNLPENERVFKHDAPHANSILSARINGDKNENTYYKMHM